MEFGIWLRAERQRRGMTEAELARRAGISQPCISTLETGTRRSPSLDTADRLARGLGVPLWVAVRDMTR